MRPPCRLPRCIQRRLAPRKYSSLTADGAFTHEEYDVVIVGGGPVGLALAGALSMPHGTTKKCCAVVIDKKIVDSSAIVRENLRIALIETSDLDPIRNWEPVPDKYSNRASSITNVAYAFLRGQFFFSLSPVRDSDGDVEDIGAWEHVQNERTCPIENMQVWDGISNARISFDAIETTRDQVKGMVRITENLNLQRGLLRLLDNVPAVDLIHKARVTSIDRESQKYGIWPIVNLNNGRRLRARLLVNIQVYSKHLNLMSGSLGRSRRIQFPSQRLRSNILFRPVL